MRVIPEGAALARGDLQLVEEAATGRYRHEHIVAVATGRDVEAVEVQVGGLVQVIDEVDTQEIAFGAPAAAGRGTGRCR